MLEMCNVSSPGRSNFSGRGFGMKKFLITTFALLYAALILSASVERYNTWIDRVADAIDHPSSGETHPGFGNVQKSDPQLSQKKFIETGYRLRNSPLLRSASHSISPANAFPRTPPSQGPIHRRTLWPDRSR